MKSRMRARISLFSSMVLAAALGFAVVIPASPAAASCSHVHSDLSSNGYIQITAESVAMRTGPHTSCGLITRWYTGDYMYPHCYIVGDSVKRGTVTFSTWSWVSLAAHGDPEGWVSDAYLSGGGANTRC